MDRYARFSVNYVVLLEGVFLKTISFEAAFLDHFWISMTVQGDKEFFKYAFLEYQKLHGAIFRPVPSL